MDFDTNYKYAQRESYEDALKRFYDKFDWIAFFDIDEFLVIKSGIKVNKWLNGYGEFDAVGINWKYFGDSGHKHVDNENFSVSRFTMSQISLDEHIKTIVNTRKTGKSNHIHICCHCTVKSFAQDSTVSVDRKNFIRSFSNRLNLGECEKIAYLAHFRCKTSDEWLKKCERNSHGIQSEMQEYKDERMKFFQEFNRNEEINGDVIALLGAQI